MEFNSIRNTIVQSKGYDMVKDLGITRGLFFKKLKIVSYRDFDSLNHTYMKVLKDYYRKGV